METVKRDGDNDTGEMVQVRREVLQQLVARLQQIQQELDSLKKDLRR